MSSKVNAKFQKEKKESFKYSFTKSFFEKGNSRNIFKNFRYFNKTMNLDLSQVENSKFSDKPRFSFKQFTNSNDPIKIEHLNLNKLRDMHYPSNSISFSKQKSEIRKNKSYSKNNEYNIRNTRRNFLPKWKLITKEVPLIFKISNNLFQDKNSKIHREIMDNLINEYKKIKYVELNANSIQKLNSRNKTQKHTVTEIKNSLNKFGNPSEVFNYKLINFKNDFLIKYLGGQCRVGNFPENLNQNKIHLFPYNFEEDLDLIQKDLNLIDN